MKWWRRALSQKNWDSKFASKFSCSVPFHKLRTKTAAAGDFLIWDSKIVFWRTCGASNIEISKLCFWFSSRAWNCSRHQRKTLLCGARLRARDGNSCIQQLPGEKLWTPRWTSYHHRQRAIQMPGNHVPTFLHWWEFCNCFYCWCAMYLYCS